MTMRAYHLTIIGDAHQPLPYTDEQITRVAEGFARDLAAKGDLLVLGIEDVHILRGSFIDSEDLMLTAMVETVP